MMNDQSADDHFEGRRHHGRNVVSPETEHVPSGDVANPVEQPHNAEESGKAALPEVHPAWSLTRRPQSANRGLRGSI